MKQRVRELLVTTKVAQNWDGQFEQKVDELIEIVNKVDTEKQVAHAGELLDVYHKTRAKVARTKKKRISESNDKPFEFLVFRN